MSFSKYSLLLILLAGCANVNAEANIKIDHVFDYSADVITNSSSNYTFNFNKCYDFDFHNVFGKISNDSFIISNIQDDMDINGNISNIDVALSIVNRRGYELTILGPLPLLSSEEHFVPSVDLKLMEKFMLLSDNQICLNMNGITSNNIPTAIHNNLSFHIDGEAAESF